VKIIALGIATLLMISAVCAELPPGTIVLEPETMQIAGTGWVVRINFDG
jgi:hypothetical protein